MACRDFEQLVLANPSPCICLKWLGCSCNPGLALYRLGPNFAGGPTCWWSSLGISIGLHSSLPESISLTGWLLCGDHYTNLGRGIGDYGGPSRNHIPVPSDFPSCMLVEPSFLSHSLDNTSRLTGRASILASLYSWSLAPCLHCPVPGHCWSDQYCTWLPSRSRFRWWKHLQCRLQPHHSCTFSHPIGNQLL